MLWWIAGTETVSPLWPTPAAYPIISPDTAAALWKELAGYLSLSLPAVFLTPSASSLFTFVRCHQLNLAILFRFHFTKKIDEWPLHILQTSSIFCIFLWSLTHTLFLSPSQTTPTFILPDKIDVRAVLHQWHGHLAMWWMAIITCRRN